MRMVVDWPSMAACRNGDPDALFVQGAEQNVAKRICRGCPVRYECLADALDNRIEFGVWGGMTERERRALLRRHPQVNSWRKTFEVGVGGGGGMAATPTPLEAVSDRAQAVQVVHVGRLDGDLHDRHFRVRGHEA